MVSVGDRWSRLLLVGSVAVLVTGVAASALQPERARPSATETPAAALATPVRTDGSPEPAGLPEMVHGLPVMSVAEAARLMRLRRLDGRFAAVGGHWSIPIVGEGDPRGCPVPAPGWWGDSLAGDHCGHPPHRAFRDEPGATEYPADSPLVPFIEQGAARSALELAPRSGEGSIPVVFIGHTADPQMWWCEVPRRCRDVFFLDQVAWVDGRDVGLEPWSDLGVPSTPLDVAARIALEAAGPGASLVAGLHGGSAPGILRLDPTLQARGPIWVARVAMEPAADGTAEGVRVVISDAGEVVLVEPFYDPDLRPSRVFLSDGAHRDLPQGHVTGFTLRSLDGSVVLEGGLGSSFWSRGTFPAIVRPGAYLLDGWHRDSDAPEHVRRDVCTAELTVAPSVDVLLSLRFRGRGCEWVPPPS